MGHSKKILFVHTLGVNWIPGKTDMSRITNIMPPLGLCSLAAWVEKFGHKSKIHDCYAFPKQDEKIIHHIQSFSPDYVGISTTTSSFFDGIRIAQLIKSTDRGIKIIFGGIHISSFKERLLDEYGVIDYGVVGEGEVSIQAILDRDGEDLDSVPGILFRKEGEAVFTGFRSKKELLDMDSLPFPAYEKLEGFPSSYKLPIFSYPQSPNTTVVSSRGCPYTCSYCDRTVFQQSFRFNSPEYMYELVKYLNKKFGIRHINYYDDLFTFNKKRVLEFSELMIKGGLKTTFNCAVRAEHIDMEMIQALKKAGCWMMSLGIESGDPELLKKHRSNSDLEMVREKVQMIRDADVRAKGLFMMGLPGETNESIAKSIKYALSLSIIDLNLAKFTPFPGSPVYKDIHKYGTFKEDWELMNCTNFVFIPKGFTKEELEKKYMEFYRRHYERPHILFGFVKMMWQSPNSCFRFLWNLRAFLSLKNSFKEKK